MWGVFPASQNDCGRCLRCTSSFWENQKCTLEASGMPSEMQGVSSHLGGPAKNQWCLFRCLFWDTGKPPAASLNFKTPSRHNQRAPLVAFGGPLQSDYGFNYPWFSASVTVPPLESQGCWGQLIVVSIRGNTSWDGPKVAKAPGTLLHITAATPHKGWQDLGQWKSGEESRIFSQESFIKLRGLCHLLWNNVHDTNDRWKAQAWSLNGIIKGATADYHWREVNETLLLFEGVNSTEPWPVFHGAALLGQRGRVCQDGCFALNSARNSV